MGLNEHFDVQVTRFTTIGARFTTAADTNTLAIIDARWDLYFENLCRTNLADALAVGTWIGNNLSRAMAMRTRLLNLEETIRHTDDTMTVTGRAGLLRSTHDDHAENDHLLDRHQRGH